MLTRWLLPVLLTFSLACRRGAEPVGNAPATEAPPARKELPSDDSLGADPRRSPHQDKATALAQCRSRANPLAAARSFYDRGEFEEALACAAQASAMMPDEPQAHSEHAAALAALSMYDDAQVAYARALALNPLEVDALLGAAHLYAVSLPSSRQRDASQQTPARPVRLDLRDGPQ